VVGGWLLLVGLAAACADALAPGGTLAGHWVNADARFDATAEKAVFTGRCQRAEFAPVVLDANGEFHAESVTLVQTGNVKPDPNARLEIQGRVAGDSLVLGLRLRSMLSSYAGDPLVTTLVRGTARDPIGCNA
jgi:hypothetical protein